MTAPLFAPFRSRRAGALMAESSWPAILLLVSGWGLFIGVVVRACATYILEEPIVWHSFAGVWFDPVLVAGTFLPMGLGLAFALIQAPRIVRERGRAVRGMWIAWGCVACAAGVAGLGVALFIAATEISNYWPLLVLLGGLTYVLILVGAVVRGAAERVPPLDALPTERCESCGYDLTHVPADRRCAECGDDIVSSLDENPRLATREAAFVAGTLAALRTARRVIFRPIEFYRAAPMRADSAAAERFGRMMMMVFWLTNVAVCAATVVAMLAIDYGRGYRSLFIDYMPALFAMSTGFTFGTYAAHRIVSAVALWWVIVSGVMPDARWGAKVMCYEAAFTWQILVFAWALFLPLPLGFDWDVELRWLSRALPFNLSPTFVLFMIGCVSLGCAWLWRLGRILRAVRYANR